MKMLSFVPVPYVFNGIFSASKDEVNVQNFLLKACIAFGSVSETVAVKHIMKYQHPYQ